MEEKLVKKAFCSSFRCDPAQKSSRGIVKPEILPGVRQCPECGHPIVWHDGKSKYRAGLLTQGKHVTARAKDLWLSKKRA